ncbi:hypothetical protein GJAV_G00122110 [Gymnothorax javanicus]|nr:hypothetical protein GJAV_G00122110 [Gymnothorax javanicus]
MRGTVAEARLEVLQVCKLLQCVHRGDKAQIQKIVSMGLPNLINKLEPQEGEGVLHLAAARNDLDMAGFLLSQGACPNLQDKRGRTPVMRAAELGHDMMMALLVNTHADMSIVDTEGKGILFYCLFPTKRHMCCLQTALSSMADVNNVSVSGKPIFLMACEHAQDSERMCISILEKGADPNATDKTTGRTPLMEASRAGALELVRAILRSGGSVNALDKRRAHAAHFAAAGGFFEVIRVLSAYLADLGVITSGGNTPLHEAARGGFTDCCRFLAQRGCNPKVKNQDGLTALQIAKDGGHRVTVKELRKAERLHGKSSKLGTANPNQRWAVLLHDWSLEHRTTLMTAFQGKDNETPGVRISVEAFITELQSQNVPVDLENLLKVAEAHDKRREGFIDLEEFFKGHRFLPKALTMASYDPKKKKKKTAKGGKAKRKGKYVLPLPVCIMPAELICHRPDGGPPHFMIEKCQQHIDTNRWDRDHPPVNLIEDDSAWYIEEPEKLYVSINQCVKTGELESVHLAINQRVPVDVQDPYYQTPLMAACASANYEAAKFLVSQGANVNFKDQYSWTALHHACHAGQVEIIDLLVQAGATIDASTLSGATPLMRAIESCRPSCVEYLIKAGAKVQAQNKNGQNCLDIAQTFADFRIVDLVKTKFESLPKVKDAQKRKGFKTPPKARPVSVAEKGPSLLSAEPSDAPVKEPPKGRIIFQNIHITSGAINKTDISFVPRTVRGQPVASSVLIQRKKDRRSRLSNAVDFEDFEMPFTRNIALKSRKLEGAQGQ